MVNLLSYWFSFIHWIFLKESYIRTYIVKKCNIKSWKPCIFTKLDTYMQCPSDLFYIDCKKTVFFWDLEFLDQEFAVHL